MNKQLSNKLASQIKQKIEKGDGVKSVNSFAIGAGFNTTDKSSACYIKDNKCTLTIRGKHYFFNLKNGW